MAKKSIKEAAMKGTSVFETIARGADGGSTQDVPDARDVPYAQDASDVRDVQNVPYVQDVLDVHNARDAPDVQDVQDVQDTKDVPQVPGKLQLERLSLKIPADLKAYLQAAAYRESSPARSVSLTEYLCNLVRADMEKHIDM